MCAGDRHFLSSGQVSELPILCPLTGVASFSSGSRSSQHLDEVKWQLISGGDRTRKCGVLLSGTSMVFDGKGRRVLQTVELDLTHATYGNFESICIEITACVPRTVSHIKQYCIVLFATIPPTGNRWEFLYRISKAKSTQNLQFCL